MPDTNHWAVLSYYALAPPAVRNVEPLGGHGGWSGSRLWRVTGPAGRQFCLRQWPAEHPTPDRLRLIHRVLRGVAEAGLAIVPAPLLATTGASFVESGGHLWELTPWLPGIADYRERPSRTRLRSAFSTLAQFHQAATSALPAQHGLAPALADRQAQLDALKVGGLEPLAAAVARGLTAELDDRARSMLQLTRMALAEVQARCTAMHQIALPLQPAIRDIHHDHVLFTGDEVTGLVDFGALRIDTLLADVARLVGSLAGDDAGARQFALDAYAERRPLTPLDRQVIDLLDESGLILGGLNWLTWLYAQRRDMGEIAPIAQRLDEILTRLQRRSRTKFGPG